MLSGIMTNRKNSSATNLFNLSSLVILFIALVGFTACSDMNLDASEGEGTINFHIANTPVSAQQEVSDNEDKNNSKSPNESSGNSVYRLQEVNVEVIELRMRYSSVGMDTESADSEVIDEDSKGKYEWITVDVEPSTINLLNLTNAYEFLTSADLAAGYYSEIRLLLGENNYVIDEIGELHSLRVPSGQQSGYKIKFNSRLHSGEEFDLTIIVDAEKSIHQTGNGQHMLHPVLQADKGRNNSN
jgi:hypothetical protein